MTASGHTQADQSAADILRTAFAALNRGDFDACTALMTDDFIINISGVPYQMHGVDMWLQNSTAARDAFPDLQAHIEDIFGEGDRVAVRLTLRGTHKGQFLGIPATGRSVEYSSLELYRSVDGKLAEEWIASDLETLMKQLKGEETPAG
ncbi:ester cyclase [Streptomyces sp. NPDC051954]|uniref:ester cyclase n=1 Tax=unclassified Streptomyces TaxID=2593676 RepID=UPI003418B77A